MIFVNGVAPTAAGPAGQFALEDPGLWSGMAVFETLRTFDGVVFRGDEHLDRLGQSVAWMGWTWDRAAITSELAACAAEGGNRKLNVLITAAQRIVASSLLDESRVGAPVRCATVPFEPPAWLPGFVKHTSRASWLLAVRDASQRLGEAVDEVIWVNDAGSWTEANRSNLLAVRGGVVYTVPLDGNVLEGVTRGLVLDAARLGGVAVVEGPVPAGERWDELYLCSTLKELAPVVRLDGRPGPGSGPVGDILRRCMQEIRGSLQGCKKA